VHADEAGVIVVERPALRRRLALRRLSRPLPRLERFLTFAGRSGRQTAATVRSVALSLKTLITVLLYRARDGSFLELAAAARGNRSALLLYGIPGVLNIVADMLRIDVIRRMNPLTYNVLYNCRMLLVALVWERVLNRRPQGVHWLSLCRILLGGHSLWANRLSVCLTKEAGPLFFDEGQGPATESTNGPETPPLPPYSPNLALTENAEPEQQKPLRNSPE